MKNKLTKHLYFAAFVATLALPLGASTSLLLNADATIKANASYLYFSATDADNFLQKAYYPGGGSGNASSLLKPDGSLTPGAIDTSSISSSWISFGSGDLTDNNTATSVNGWGGFTKWQANGKNRGPYILFDLGAEYALTQVDIKLSNANSQGWNGDAGAQRVWTATDLSAIPGTGTSLSTANTYWTQTQSFTYTSSASVSTYSIALSGAPTRYVLLLLTTGNVDSYNPGGIINDVNFYIAGPSIPEPSVATLFLGIAGVAVILLFRKRQ